MSITAGWLAFSVVLIARMRLLAAVCVCCCCSCCRARALLLFLLLCVYVCVCVCCCCSCCRVCVCRTYVHCAGEWEQSIRDSHPPSPETDAALATHRAEVQRIRTALQRYSEYVQQLCEASHTLASATAAADSSSSSSGPGSTAAAAAVSEQALQQAVGVLRQAAAHVKWF